MTVEDIKHAYTMRDILIRYGITVNKKEFACCPFHQEKTPSMQVFHDSYRCYGCGEYGDIFDFVQKMDHLDFKDAYLLLGGEYQHNFSARLKADREQKRRQAIETSLNALKEQISTKYKDITISQSLLRLCEPFDDDWCYIKNELDLTFAKIEMLESEVDEIRRKQFEH